MPTMKNSFSGCANSTTPCRGTDPQEGWFGSIRGGEGDRCLDDRIQSQQQFPKGGQVRPEASGHDDPVNLGLTGAPGQVALASARGFQPTRHVRNAIGDPAGVRGPAIDRQTVQTEGGVGVGPTARGVDHCSVRQPMPCALRVAPDHHEGGSTATLRPDPAAVLAHDGLDPGIQPQSGGAGGMGRQRLQLRGQQIGITSASGGCQPVVCRKAAAAASIL